MLCLGLSIILIVNLFSTIEVRYTNWVQMFNAETGKNNCDEFCQNKGTCELFEDIWVCRCNYSEIKVMPHHPCAYYEEEDRLVIDMDEDGYILPGRCPTSTYCGQEATCVKTLKEPFYDCLCERSDTRPYISENGTKQCHLVDVLFSDFYENEEGYFAFGDCPTYLYCGYEAFCALMKIEPFYDCVCNGSTTDNIIRPYISDDGSKQCSNLQTVEIPKLNWKQEFNAETGKKNCDELCQNRGTCELHKNLWMCNCSDSKMLVMPHYSCPYISKEELASSKENIVDTLDMSLTEDGTVVEGKCPTSSYCGKEAVCVKKLEKPFYDCFCPISQTRPYIADDGTKKCHYTGSYFLMNNEKEDYYDVRDHLSPPVDLLSLHWKLHGNKSSNQIEIDGNGLSTTTIVLITLFTLIAIIIPVGCLLKLFYHQRRQFKTISGSFMVPIDSKSVPLSAVPLSVQLSKISLIGAVKHIDCDQLQAYSFIGEGCFGRVYKAELRMHGSDQFQPVAIKILKKCYDESDVDDLGHEIDILSNCQHTNIVQFLGIILPSSIIENKEVKELLGGRCSLLFEYMSEGNLAEMLRKLSPCWSKLPHPISSSQQLDFARQICSGMAYLSSQRVVHRDLACRNILVDEHYTLKISDFGLSRDIYSCDYYKIEGNRRLLPVRWIAPECILYGKFSFESDVWSFGIVIWEIYSWGTQPYCEFTNQQVMECLRNYTLLKRPQDCPDAVHEIMMDCWKSDPILRPPFSKLLDRLEKIVAVCDNH